MVVVVEVVDLTVEDVVDPPGTGMVDVEVVVVDTLFLVVVVVQEEIHVL